MRPRPPQATLPYIRHHHAHVQLAACRLLALSVDRCRLGGSRMGQPGGCCRRRLLSRGVLSWVGRVVAPWRSALTHVRQ
eukprot:12041844-Alexandrium_andersonii.AAC.1